MSGVVYFVAVRTETPENGREVGIAMKALKDQGLLADPPLPDNHRAVAWCKGYAEMGTADNAALRTLGLDWNGANQIATIASEGERVA